MWASPETVKVAGNSVSACIKKHVVVKFLVNERYLQALCCFQKNIRTDTGGIVSL